MFARYTAVAGADALDHHVERVVPLAEEPFERLRDAPFAVVRGDDDGD